jgi:hypothetical protein
LLTSARNWFDQNTAIFYMSFFQNFHLHHLLGYFGRH